MSRNHLEIKFDIDHIYIKDLGSRILFIIQVMALKLITILLVHTNRYKLLKKILFWLQVFKDL